jgi:hypothetical protein
MEQWQCSASQKANLQQQPQSHGQQHSGTAAGEYPAEGVPSVSVGACTVVIEMQATPVSPDVVTPPGGPAVAVA